VCSCDMPRDINETLAYETRPRHLVFGPRRDWDQDLPAIPRDRDVWFLPRDKTETETLQCRDRDVFRDLQPSALCQNKIMATFKLKLFMQEISSSWDGRPWPHMRPKEGDCCAPFAESWDPNTMSPGRRSTSVPSGVFVHPAIWPQQTWNENWRPCPF